MQRVFSKKKKILLHCAIVKRMCESHKNYDSFNGNNALIYAKYDHTFNYKHTLIMCAVCVRVNDEARDDVNCRKSKLPTKTTTTTINSKINKEKCSNNNYIILRVHQKNMTKTSRSKQNTKYTWPNNKYTGIHSQMQ